MELKTDRDKTAHLLRRFGLGASEAEVDYYSKGGLRGAIDALLNYEQVDEGFDVPIAKFKAGAKGRVAIQGVQAWWVTRLLATRRPLQEKMTLFWHNHFATSAEKVNQPVLMYQQNQVLRERSTGKFSDLLMEVSKDPAMLLWLDNQFNQVGRANENFAREVMELFTLGIGHYSEKDIQESARAFTGWAFRRTVTDEDDFGNGARTAVFQFRPKLHDEGTKTFLGKTGNFGGEDIIAILCNSPQMSRFITAKMWKWFAYPDPEPSIVERLSDNWMRSGLDIKVLIRSIMESPEFYSDKAYRHVFKNPVDFVIAPMRQLGIGGQLVDAIKTMDEVTGPTRAIVAAAQQAMKSMGMPLFFPPDVSGWELGSAWVTSATMVERIQMGSTLFGLDKASPGRPRMHYDAYPLFKDAAGLDGVVTRLLSILDIDLADDKVRALVHCANELTQGNFVAQNSDALVTELAKLVFGCPEYQFC